MELMQQIFAKKVAIILIEHLGRLQRNSLKIKYSNSDDNSISDIYQTHVYSKKLHYKLPRYFINYSQRQDSELPPEQLPHKQQNMYYFRQDNQENMKNFQQENDANDSSIANEGSLSQYIQSNK
ncbi:unnamed protein product [Parnassius apollo]|uniref:(apollo) hypothetical protein n=1 Tax=Parnassius apollo TaxID=110799 RepID=A0A8S3YAH9_PARAO|nr:unnamed protein product [Parnassius apollo]